ncbi:MAG: sigma 54-interacting transcriptional regulator [Lachnospiraceae bacterium]|nr:sigma 54-interacting transcriptional regulator [Lachnospiraceae bacterium]
MSTAFEHDSNYIRNCWEHFIRGDFSEDYSRIRPEILESWKRSREHALNPMEISHVRLTRPELEERIRLCLPVLEVVRPYMEQLYSIVKGTDVYISFSDKDAYVLELLGDPSMSEQLKQISKFSLGSSRSEAVAGTNAIGTAIYTKKPIQIWSEEHYLLSHKNYVCSGAPILDDAGNVLGCINITGRASDIHAHTLGMVMCAAKGIANEVKLHKAYKDIELISSQRNRIVQSMDAGVILLNSVGYVIEINKEALRMLKLEHANIIGKELFSYISLGANAFSQKRSEASAKEDLAFVKRKQTHVEINIFRKGSSDTPIKYTITTNPIERNDGISGGTIITLNELQSIHKLVGQVSGFRAKYTYDSIIGKSQELLQMLDTCRQASQTESNILILGESGTGKELIAQAIHNGSPRAKGPFVAVNCASIPHDLVESELFGYERGAFTGALKDGRPGKFELADGGTIFLDEIGDMPIEAQSSLLRVLQMREVTRIGGKYPKQIDVHIIAATNQDLAINVENRTFRQDLYYRLNVMTIHVPALRERKGDSLLLAEYFLNRYSRGRSLTLSPEVADFIQQYNWPGNIRQLENAMERASNLAPDQIIEFSHLSKDLLDARDQLLTARKSSVKVSSDMIIQEEQKNLPGDSQTDPLLNYSADEKNAIIKALIQCRGNVSKAGLLLNYSRRTMYRRLEEYGINPIAFRRNHQS